MKIAVYTIAKNEEKHVRRFVESCKDVDEIVVADTGSTDATVDLLRKHGAQVYEITIDPWRFDDARNVALSLVSPDVDWCVQLDLDEVMEPDWRMRFTRAVEKSPSANQLRFGYAWNESITFMRNSAHSRTGWRWKDPIHEAVVNVHNHYKIASCEGVLVRHLADGLKNPYRHSQYLNLLERAVQEDPTNERMRLYLLREQIFGDWWTHNFQRATAHHIFGRFACSRGFFVEGMPELERALQMSESEVEKRIIAADIDRFKSRCGGVYG